jgi:hypothetical protein
LPRHPGPGSTTRLNLLYSSRSSSLACPKTHYFVACSSQASTLLSSIDRVLRARLIIEDLRYHEQSQRRRERLQVGHSLGAGRVDGRMTAGRVLSLFSAPDVESLFLYLLLVALAPRKLCLSYLSFSLVRVCKRYC